ncbi:MAG TPA: alpha/beta fold hydrolase [Humisphaera sp.]
MTVRTILILVLALFCSASPRPAPAATTSPLTAPATQPAGIVGTWLGTLDVGTAKLRLGLKVTTRDGKLAATLDSIDQRAPNLPVDAVTLEGDRVRFTMTKLLAGYDGTLKPDGKTIAGTFTQAGTPLPLKFERVDALPTLGRPQEPKPPLPYKVEEVAYDSAPGVKLAATLTLPKDGKGPFPAVVLITGSGPQDRDEALMGHRPFLVLADYLTRRGIAVLRADDRGVSKSTGNFATATTDDFATDALAGVAFLKTRGEIDKRRIGLIGHSEGGVVAPIAAARQPDDVAFVALLAGMGEPMADLLVRQVGDILAADGTPPDVVAKAVAAQRATMDVLKAGGPLDEVKRKLHDVVAKQRAALTPEQRAAMGFNPGSEDAAVAAATSPWLLWLIAYDPEVTLRKVKCPVLAINGGRDLQVSAKHNLPKIAAALAAGGNKDITTVELPELNHLFQRCKTGLPKEYGTIEETINEAALKAVGEWLEKRVK